MINVVSQIIGIGAVTALAASLAVSLGACGSGSGNSAGRAGMTDGMLSLGVTDAPVDSASEVWVEFTGVSIKPAEGSVIEKFYQTPKRINLLALQGAQFDELLPSESLAVGQYVWIRLHVNAVIDGTLDSYIKLTDGSEHELFIPSGSQTGLKINQGFAIQANQQLSLMIDFDLRKSVIVAGGKYKLKPVLRVIDVSMSDHVSGIINPALLTALECSDADPDTGNAVYLYEGHNVIPDDMDKKPPEPVSSAIVALNTASGFYEYTIGFVPAGDYTLSFTCQADLDEPETSQDIVFSSTENITVTVDTEPPINPAR